MSLSQDNDRGNVGSRFWRSVFRGPVRPATTRTARGSSSATSFSTTARSGSPRRRSGTPHVRSRRIVGVLFSLLVATGMLLIFVYEPSPDAAYRSILRLRDDVFFGKLVRNIHYWSANLLVVVALLHLLRVYLTGAYHGARRFNWVLGLALLFCVLASNFTGYLLPWNQLSYWAITIVTGMIGYVPFVGETLQNAVRGGREIGASTLVDFYARTPRFSRAHRRRHGVSFLEVRKAGGVVLPRPPEGAPAEAPDRRSAAAAARAPRRAAHHPRPHGSKSPPRCWRSPIFFTASSPRSRARGFVMVLALLFDAPLGDPANPG